MKSVESLRSIRHRVSVKSQRQSTKADHQRTSNLRLLKCLNVPPTMPGTPAILSSRMIRNNQFLSDNSCPFARSSSIGIGFKASVASSIGIDLYPVARSKPFLRSLTRRKTALSARVTGGRLTIWTTFVSYNENQ